MLLTNVLDLETETAVTVTGEVSFENNQGDSFLVVSSSFPHLPHVGGVILDCYIV